MQSTISHKISAYVGLLAAIVLGYVFLYPQKARIFEAPTHITIFDNDLISFIVKNNNPHVELLIRTERYKSRCSKGPLTPNATMCEIPEYAPDATQLVYMQDELNSYIPGFSVELNEWINGDMSSDKMASIQQKVIAIYPKLLPRYRANYIVTTWFAHGLFFLLLLALVWWRRQLGGALIALVLFPIKVVFKGASSIHRNI